MQEADPRALIHPLACAVIVSWPERTEVPCCPEQNSSCISFCRFVSCDLAHRVEIVSQLFSIPLQVEVSGFQPRITCILLY